MCVNSNLAFDANIWTDNISNESCVYHTTQGQLKLCNTCKWNSKLANYCKDRGTNCEKTGLTWNAWIQLVQLGHNACRFYIKHPSPEDVKSKRKGIQKFTRQRLCIHYMCRNKDYTELDLLQPLWPLYHYKNKASCMCTCTLVSQRHAVCFHYLPLSPIAWVIKNDYAVEHGIITAQHKMSRALFLCSCSFSFA